MHILTQSGVHAKSTVMTLTSDNIVWMLFWTSDTLAATLYASGATAWPTPSGKVQPDQSPSQVKSGRHCQVMTPLGFSEGCTVEHGVVGVAPGLALRRNGAAGQTEVMGGWKRSAL